MNAVQNAKAMSLAGFTSALTSMEAEVRAVRPDYDAFVKGLQIQPEPEGEQAGMAGQADADRGSR